MHTAMKSAWSGYEDRAHWGIWVFFANQHKDGYGLGGIMFDSVGLNQRQGSAIFNNSFVSKAPNNISAEQKEKWIKRNRFWCAIHEAGHALNLAHAWQKALGEAWIQLVGDGRSLSFMNYPQVFNKSNEDEFWAKFEWKFTQQEYLFLRHSPREFVEPGNSGWFENHGLGNEGPTVIRFEQKEEAPK